jgi:hypothetical protein
MKILACLVTFLCFASAKSEVPWYMETEGSEDLPNPYTHLELFIERARESIPLIPDPLLQRLLDFKNNQQDYVLFKGLPTDSCLPPTPGANFSPFKDPYAKPSFVSEFCLSVFGLVLGEPFNYIQ